MTTPLKPQALDLLLEDLRHEIYRQDAAGEPALHEYMTGADQDAVLRIAARCLRDLLAVRAGREG